MHGTKLEVSTLDHIGLMELAHMMRECRINKSLRLVHVNIFRDRTVQECIINIHLCQDQPFERAMHKTIFDCLRFDNQTKIVFIINTWSLMKAFSNKSYFVTCNGSILISFQAKHPFVPNDIKVWLIRNQGPCAIGHKGYKFFRHSLFSVMTL